MSETAYSMANSIDPDQTAPLEQFDLGLNCFLRSFFPNIKGIIAIENK